MFNFRPYFISSSSRNAYRTGARGSNGASYVIVNPANDYSFQHIYSTTDNINFSEEGIENCTCSLWSGDIVRITSSLSALAQHNDNNIKYGFIGLGL